MNSTEKVALTRFQHVECHAKRFSHAVTNAQKAVMKAIAQSVKSLSSKAVFVD
jgi:hypothetical protein